MKNNRNIQLARIILTAAAVAVTGSVAFADTAALLELSLEELMQVDVAGTLTERNPRRVPASITVITAEDIAHTPARNLLDLIEVYVPGALWMNHSMGPQIGIRGIIADRNYKYLINVNGRNVNTRVAYGAIAELSLWDLNDIEKVEIIRGPGSVTYGPGAIAGVINITLKRASTSPGTEAGAMYWDKYHARGGHLSHGHVGEDTKPNIFSYVSVVDHLGHVPDQFVVNLRSGNVVADYLAKSIPASGDPRPDPVATYFTAFQGEPQIKAYVDADFKNGWRFWTRYTSGTLPKATESHIKFPFSGTRNDGPWVDFRDTRLRQYIATLENRQKLNEDFELRSVFSFSSTDLREISRYIANQQQNPSDLIHYGRWFSEDNYFAKFQLNYDSHDRWRAAVGFEYNYTVIGPAWGRNAHNGLRIDDMISGPDSDAYGTDSGQVTEASDNYFAIGDGWKSQSHGIFGEINVDLAEKWSALVSGRLDKHTYTGYMFSPRAALIHEISEDNWLKFVVQRSVRMNTEEELYRTAHYGNKNRPEKLDTYELMYHGWLNEATSIKLAGFYNDNDVIAWDSGSRSSAPVGTLKTAGAELEALYNRDNWTLGANHSFVKQLDWKTAPDLSRSGISYSDYYYSGSSSGAPGDGTITLLGVGNNLSNYSNHITKLFARARFADKFTLHADMRIFWEFTGGKDGLQMLQNAENSDKPSLDVLRSKDAYDLLISGGLSLTYHVNPSADLSVFVHNIPIVGDNKRYAYSSGHTRHFANKTTWIEEPMAIGARFVARF